MLTCHVTLPEMQLNEKWQVYVSIALRDMLRKNDTDEMKQNSRMEEVALASAKHWWC